MDNKTETKEKSYYLKLRDEGYFPKFMNNVSYEDMKKRKNPPSFVAAVVNYILTLKDESKKKDSEKIDDAIIMAVDINENLYNNNNSKAQNYTRIRNAFRKIGVEDKERLDLLQLAKKEKQKRVDKNRGALMNNMENMIIIKRKDINKIVEELDTNVQNDKIILLTLATGRRFIEVMRVSDITKSEKKGHIKITGLAKQRLDRDKNPINEIDVPLKFIDYKTMKKYLAEVRENIPEEYDNEKLTNMYVKPVNKRIKQLFPEIDDKYANTRLLRKIYGSIAVEEDKPQTLHSSIYLNYVLGHTKNSNSYKNYVNIDIIPNHKNMDHKNMDKKILKPESKEEVASDEEDLGEQKTDTKRQSYEGMSISELLRLKDQIGALIIKKKNEERRKKEKSGSKYTRMIADGRMKEMKDFYEDKGLTLAAAKYKMTKPTFRYVKNTYFDKI